MFRGMGGLRETGYDTEAMGKSKNSPLATIPDAAAEVSLSDQRDVGLGGVGAVRRLCG